MQPQPLKPILAAPLLAKVDGRLLELLRGLGPLEWRAATIAPGWTVKDVAAHLLDTALRKLSLCRDGHAIPSPGPAASETLVELVNRANREGVAWYGRLSPAVLIELMALATEKSAAYHESLDPFADAVFSVSWAGETRSPNWFDTARELTERWHHQQQIRLALDRPGIMTPELYRPVLDCFMRALPFSYRTLERPAGATAQITISGDCGGDWFLCRQAGAWTLLDGPLGEPLSRTSVPQDVAWRVFTKGIARAAAERAVQISGDRELGLRLLDTLAIVG